MRQADVQHYQIGIGVLISKSWLASCLLSLNLISVLFEGFHLDVLDIVQHYMKISAKLSPVNIAMQMPIDPTLTLICDDVAGRVG